MENSVFELDAPISVGIITTNRCNLKCVHCMNESTMSVDEELSTNEIINIIDQSADAGVAFVEFNGGEFFVRSDVEQLLDYALMRNVRISITTNGTLISDDWIKKYDGKISLLRISLDSHIELIHDEFRGVKGSFNKTIATIDKLLKNKYTVTILTTVTRSRVSTFNEFVRFLEGLGVAGLHTTLLIPAGRGKNIDYEVLSPEEHKNFLEEYRRIKSTVSKSSNLHVLEESPQAFLLNDEILEGDYLVKCGAAFTEVVVLNDGYVLPCASFISVRDQYKTDDLNIRNNNLIDIYKNGDLMKKTRDTSLIKGSCSECEYLRNCGGGCRASANIVNEDVLSSDPMCWLVKNDDANK